MNTERDKFLTEAMGECWYEHTMTCGYNLTRTSEYISDIKSTSYPNDFSSWSGFGKLWEWAQKQDWWCKFLTTKGRIHDLNPLAFATNTSLVSPDNFASAVYQFLKEVKDE